MKQHLAHLALLFHLKCLLMWRSYCRDVSAAIGILLAVIVLVPFSLAAAFGSLVGYAVLPPPDAEHLLRGVLLAAYLIWLGAPLVGFALTEDYDLSKLLPYPLSARVIFAGAILGSLIDLGVLLLLPSLLVALIAFTKGIASFGVAALALGFFLFHAVALSQTIKLAAAGVLRSRRARDAMIVLVPLAMMSVWLLFQVGVRGATDVNWRQFLEGPTWQILSYLPPGLAARAIAGAARGDLGAALAFLLLIGLISATTLYLAGWLVHLVYTGEAVAGRVRRRAVPQAAAPAHPTPAGMHAAAPPATIFGIRLPPALHAMLDKEVKYLFRDPYFRLTFVVTFYMVAVVLVVFLAPGRFGGGQPWRGSAEVMVWAASAFLLSAQMALPFNIFGADGAAASLLFLFPTRRRQIVIAKNVIHLAALTAVNSIIMLALSAVAGRAHLLPRILIWLELATVLLIACGNLVSVWLPNRVVVQGWRVRQQSSSRGLAYGFAYMGLMAAFACLSLPILAAVVVPSYFVSPLWFGLTLPAAAAYAAAAYLISLHYTEQSLLAREPEIAQKLGAKE